MQLNSGICLVLAGACGLDTLLQFRHKIAIRQRICLVNDCDRQLTAGRERDHSAVVVRHSRGRRFIANCAEHGNAVSANNGRAVDMGRAEPTGDLRRECRERQA